MQPNANRGEGEVEKEGLCHRDVDTVICEECAENTGSLSQGEDKIKMKEMFCLRLNFLQSNSEFCFTSDEKRESLPKQNPIYCA